MAEAQMVRRADLLNDLKGARAMIGQAQERCKVKGFLWRDFGRIYEEIDSFMEYISVGDYDEEILNKEG